MSQEWQVGPYYSANLLSQPSSLNQPAWRFLPTPAVWRFLPPPVTHTSVFWSRLSPMSGFPPSLANNNYEVFCRAGAVGLSMPGMDWESQAPFSPNLLF